MRTILIGLGNPLLGDDSVGWLVAERVREQLAQLADARDVEIVCCDDGGVGLMERLIGYDTAVLVDAMTGRAARAGELRRLELEDAGSVPFWQASAHGVSLPTALALGRASGACLPRSIVLIGIEAQAVDVFGPGLSPEVDAALPAAVAAVLDELERAQSHECTAQPRPCAPRTA